MVKETINNFVKNWKFFAIVLGIVIISIVFSLFASKSTRMEEVEELPDNANVLTNKIIINEIQSSNGGTYADSNGNTYDWIELYNGSSKDKDLSGYSLSDKNNQIKWAFPEGTIINAKGYLIVFLSGTKESGLYANFKLKASGGEVLALRNRNKKIIDAIETVSVSKNQVMARMEDGKFVVSNTPTPGYENSKKGYEEFISSYEYSEDKVLSITEILPNNKGYFKNYLGDYSGYVEITNVSNNPVNLKGYTLSNSLSTPYKWALPDVVLGKNEVLLIYTSNKNLYDEEYHANFKLNNTDGVVVLSNKNKIIEKVEYNGLINGLAYIKDKDVFYESNMISPGYLNDSNGISEFQKKYYVKNDGLVINEVMNSNYSYLAQNGNNYYDWIELYNNSKETINLKDYYLTTTTNNPKKYKLPDVELKPDSYYILMASGDTNLSNNSYKHTNFKLSDNEGLFLYKNNKVIDSMFISNIPVGNSYGRSSNSGLYYFSSPTPGKVNGSGNMQISYTPLFNKEAGVYNNVENLELVINCPGKLYYSTDGSYPSKTYSSPLNLKSTTVIKALCSESGKANSKIVTNSYIINENHTLPVLSISISPSDYSSILSHAWTTGYEKSAYAELFEEGNSFSIPAGLKLFGGSARSERKKSYAITFKKKYGKGSLNYQVFDNRDNSVYDTLVIRSGSQDNNKAIIRDILGTSLVDGKINVDVQAYKSVILYINGKYYGVYFIREKVDENFIAAHYNVDGTKSDIIRIDGGVIYGSRTKYNKLISYINSHDLSKKEYYDEISKMIDIDSVIDYWVAEAYVTNNDIINCKMFTNPDVNDGKWKYIFYDLDYALYNYFVNYYSFSTKSSGMGSRGIPTTILRNLMKNSEFKKKYTERVAFQLKEVWNQERIMEKYNEILNELEPEMDRDLARWGRTRSEWNYELGRLKTYIEKRESYMKSQTKSFFNLSNSEYKELFD